MIARSLRSFGIFGEIGSKQDAGKLSANVVARAQSATQLVSHTVRAQALRFAPAVISVTIIGILAASRLASVGVTQPVAADLNLGRTAVLDDISATDVAAAVATMSDMIVADQVVAQAEEATEPELNTIAETQITKPQLVATDIKTADDVVVHTVADGETLDAIASKYGLSVNTIKWSNSITGNSVDAGTELTIPPVNGVMHTVADGDTADSIAKLYKADAQQIIAFNDAEVSGLVPGEKIVVPNGEKPAPVREAVYNVINTGSRSRYRFFSVNSTYLGNWRQLGLRSGWCTHWAYARAAQLGNPMPSSLGNAYSWPSRARAAGMVVDKTPVVGAVAQRNNHVVVVEAVSADGSMIKYSDQNGLEGWGRVGVTNDWVPASGFAWYIHR